MTRLVNIFLTISLLLGAYHQGFAQKKKKARTYLKLYYQETNGERFLLADLKAKVNKKFVRIGDAELTFANSNDSADVDLGKATTDAKGQILFPIPKDKQLVKNTSGNYEFSVRYNGNQEYKKRKGSAEVIPVKLSLELNSEGENKAVILKGALADTAATALTDIEVQLLVKRMFAWHKIGEGTIDEGAVEIEFPNDLPGGNSGKLIIACRIDNDDMGKIILSKTADWGTKAEVKQADSSSGKQHYIVFMAIAISLAYLVSLGLKSFFK